MTELVIQVSFFSSSAEGNTHWLYKLLYNDWEEHQLTYRIYKTGSPWAVGGLFGPADFVIADPDGAPSIIPNLLA
ncbi:unnamed protein product, partial [marine sediment metagenome]